MELSGRCHCGNIQIELNLGGAPGAHAPRTCDCDFCRKHGASYVSDAHGSLRIRIERPADSAYYRQGSGQAEFLLCGKCGVLVAVLHRSDGRLYGTVNVNVTDRRDEFAAAARVSPKTLSAIEKTRRWQELWFSDVTLDNAEA